VLQTGNQVQASWRARLADQLGQFSVELVRGHAAAAMSDAAALAGLTAMAGLLRLLPERDPHASLYEVTLFVLSFLDEREVWPALLVRWEVALLAELGAGLDLSQCAAGGGNDGLAYVSPRTGRAVSASAGEPYRDRLLRLPPFLSGKANSGAGLQDVQDGLRLTGYFLEQRIFVPRAQQMPDARRRLPEILASADRAAI
jgi:DNA repair protein RecO (recombination protein O)